MIIIITILHVLLVLVLVLLLHSLVFAFLLRSLSIRDLGLDPLTELLDGVEAAGQLAGICRRHLRAHVQYLAVDAALHHGEGYD